eukprot:9463974-Pyramimonas_sp.AAC.1
MLREEAAPPDDFNLAYLICLPKCSGTLTSTGEDFYDPCNTRPLSIVDASNRILASIFRVALERSAAPWVSAPQKGFLQGRHMIRNVLDVDFVAHNIS